MVARRIKADIENLKYDRDLVIQQKATFPYGVLNKKLLDNKLSEIDAKINQLQKELKNYNEGNTETTSRLAETIYIGEVKMGDTFNVSGDFRGAILNIKSTLTDVSQSITTIPNANESVKHELRELVHQLNDELQKIPPEKREEAEAVAETTKSLVEAVGKEKPNKTFVQLSAKGLKEAAENLAVVTPTILTIATQIVAAIMKMIG